MWVWVLNEPLDILLMKLDLCLFFTAYSKVKFFVYLLESVYEDGYFCFATI